MLGWSFLLLSETTVSGQKKKEIIHSFFSPNFISHEKKNHWFHLYIIFSCVPWLYFPSLKMWKNYFKDFMKTKIMRKNVFSTWFNMKKTFFYPVFSILLIYFLIFLIHFSHVPSLAFHLWKHVRKNLEKCYHLVKIFFQAKSFFFFPWNHMWKKFWGKNSMHETSEKKFHNFFFTHATKSSCFLIIIFLSDFCSLHAPYHFFQSVKSLSCLRPVEKKDFRGKKLCFHMFLNIFICENM